EIAGLDEKLAETIAAIEAELESKRSARAPAGYSVRSVGGALVVGRDHCVTSETMWKWRELDWPMREEEAPEEGEWRKLAWLAGTCAVAGLAGAVANHFVPGWP